MMHVLLALVLFISCNKSKNIGPNSDPDPCFDKGIDTCNAVKPKIIISLNDEKQVIDNFGASDGWSTKFVGNWANNTKKNLIADYLFSLDTNSNGSPKGIGLSLWRFQIGSGSTEQGASSTIPDEWRRSECFLAPNGTYNWQKQSGQQWFLEAAKARGLNNFLAFVLSPPVQFTVNNKATGLANSQYNLNPVHTNNFADFLVNVVQHFNGLGYNFKYLSPFNEPQYDWGSSGTPQEGSGATNSFMASFIKLLGPKLNAVNSPTNIAFGEAASWNYSYAEGDNRGNQINQFFNPNSSNYIGNTPKVENIFSAHSYFTTCPDASLINFRNEALNARNRTSTNLKLWQTEFGILMDICGKYNGFPRNIGIDYGLYVAKVMHHDLAVANVSAWHWWLAVSPYDYSDALVYINDPNGGFDLNASKTDGIVLDSKQLWCMGNYSRFVRPGMKRVGASLSTVTNSNVAAATQMISAYKDSATKKFVIVIVNMEASLKNFTFDTTNVELLSNKLSMYTTSDARNLFKSTVDANNITIPGKSVVTIVGNYK